MRIFLAIRGTKMRMALRLLLEQQPGLELAGEAADAEELLPQLDDNHPDLLLIDWDLSGSATVTVLRLLCKRYPALRVVALRGPQQVPPPVDGVDAFRNTGDPPDRLLETIRALQHCPGKS